MQLFNVLVKIFDVWDGSEYISSGIFQSADPTGSGLEDMIRQQLEETYVRDFRFEIEIAPMGSLTSWIQTQSPTRTY